MAHRARLDVPAPILKAVTGWIARARRLPGMRPWQRAATVHAQVLLVLRWLRHRADLHNLARDAQVSDATAYRYLHEGLERSPPALLTCTTCSMPLARPASPTSEWTGP